ncbi:MAG TPA: hypothetical protein VHS59_01735 [Bacillota bacterium]|nr:hypothetical protein [Bacillota bacterium]
MGQLVDIIFHNDGWKSWIECSFCAICPGSKGKGCCCYKPLFLPRDLGYLRVEHPEVLAAILQLRPLTILASSVTVENRPGEDGTMFCRFHSDRGCTLPIGCREYICRRFVCNRIPLWQQPGAEKWKLFFVEMEAREAALNAALNEELRAAGADLRKDREHYLAILEQAFHRHYPQSQDWFSQYPKEERFSLEVDSSDWQEWAK